MIFSLYVHMYMEWHGVRKLITAPPYDYLAAGFTSDKHLYFKTSKSSNYFSHFKP